MRVSGIVVLKKDFWIWERLLSFEQIFSIIADFLGF